MGAFSVARESRDKPLSLVIAQIGQNEIEGTAPVDRKQNLGSGRLAQSLDAFIQFLDTPYFPMRRLDDDIARL